MKELLCQKCGSSISAGLMFCPICGAKPNPEKVEENARAKPSHAWPLKGRWGLVASLLFILLVIIVGLAAWPNTGVIGDNGYKNNAKFLISQIQIIKTLSEGRTLAVKLNESDINAYLKFVRVPKAEVAFCRVELMPDLVHVRSGKKIGPYKFYKSDFSPKISVDIWYKMDDNALVVSKVLVGHLPIIGSLKSLVETKVLAMVLGDSENYIWLNNIVALEVKEKRVVITAKNDLSSHKGELEDESGAE